MYARIHGALKRAFTFLSVSSASSYMGITIGCSRASSTAATTSNSTGTPIHQAKAMADELQTKVCIIGSGPAAHTAAIC